MSSQQQNTEEILRRLDDMEISQGKRFKAIEDKLNPIHDVFTSVDAFSRISVYILKLLAVIGTAILSLYVIIEFFKRLGKA